MATIRIYNYEYGNYNETITPNTSDLNVLFQAPLAVFDDINISYNDGIMLTLTLNINDDLIEKVNYLTIDSGYHKGRLTFSDFITTNDEAYFTDEGGIKLGDIDEDWGDEQDFVDWLQDNEYDPDEMERGLYYVYSYDTNLYYGITLSKYFDTYDNIRPYFVLGYQYIMKDQYAVSCKLDTVLYKLDDIKEANALVERGFISEDNKLIYNNEGIQVTSIKQKELPLNEVITKYNNKVSADVGYYAVYADNKLGSTDKDEDKLELRLTGAEDKVYATYSKLSDVPIYKYFNNPTTFGKIKKAETYVRGYNYEQSAVGASGAMRGFILKSSDTLKTKNYTHLNKFLTTDGGTTQMNDKNVPFSDYKKEHEFYNTDSKLGIVNSSKGFGGYRYEVDGVELPYQGFYDFRRNALYVIGIFAGYRWGGIEYAGGVGVGYRESGTHTQTILESFSPEEVTDAVKLNTLDGVQYSSSSVSGTKLSASELLAWNDRLIKVGDDVFRIKVDKSEKTNTLVRATSPSKMLEYAYNDTEMKDQVWLPKSDANSVRILNKKNEINRDLWSKDYYWGLQSLTSKAKADLTDTTKEYNYETIHYTIDSETYKVSMFPEFIGGTKVIKTFGGSGEGTMLVPVTKTQPYKILLFPFGNIMLKSDERDSDDSGTMQTEERVLNVVNNIINDYGGIGSGATRIYDVQRVPYGTVDLSKYAHSVYGLHNLIYFIEGEGGGKFDINKDEMYLIKDDEFTPKLVMFTPYSSSRTFEVETPQQIVKKNIKLDLSTRTAIAMSNTYKTQYYYEFVKNNYNNKFKITVDLKPITSYFNIDPVGSDVGLLQGNYNDGRGINQAEDLSATQITDAYNAYKRENMNYLNSFNSQQEYQRNLYEMQADQAKAVQNLQQKQAWTQWLASSAQGIASGVGQGALLGITLGATVPVASGLNQVDMWGDWGPAGALQPTNIGDIKSAQSAVWKQTGASMGAGLAGGVLNAAAGAMGTAISNKQSREMLSLTQAQGRDNLGLQQAQAREQFNYSVENIQALPARLDKVSGVTSLTKNTARLALYDTTPEERVRVEKYFDLNGYTLNTYDTLGKYIDFDKDMTYVKGSIYKFNKSINNTILQDINTRLAVGIQFKKVGEE